MSEEIKQTYDDKREIDSIEFSDGEYYSVKQKSIDAIKPYNENGGMTSILWFAVYENGKIMHRVNSNYITVVNYKHKDVREGEGATGRVGTEGGRLDT